MPFWVQFWRKVFVLTGFGTLFAFGGSEAAGDHLKLPQNVDRGRPIEAVYHFDAPVTGRGLLVTKWTDTLGRIVERRRIPLNLADAAVIRFPLDPARAVAVKNELSVRIVLDRNAKGSTPPGGEHRAIASFIVSPYHTARSDYQIIMWHSQTVAGYRALKRIGVTAAAVMSDRLDQPGSRVMEQVDTLLTADLRWYVENTATDFYAAYHRWFPDRPVNWFFEQTKRRYQANPKDVVAFIREPSLSDPEWLAKIEHRLTGIVRALRPYRPLFYNLADEPGIADLAAFWDFDLSPSSLAGMREWLRRRYRDLARLNDQWGTAFASWDDVMPMTTREAMKQMDENFSAWADFKEWMNVAFARALKRGTEAIHAADPTALSAIEGGQIPGWGGYDYSRFPGSVDLVEVGDDGDADTMLRSFSPNTGKLTTSFGSGAAEEHRVWRQLLRGSRGLILWDDKREFVDEEGAIGKRSHDAEPYFGEIRNGLGALLINSRPLVDPIAVLYSPASLSLEWLLDRIRDGNDWAQRDAESEWADTRARAVLRNYVHRIRHSGLQHRFVSAEQIIGGELERAGYRVLILPETTAMADRTATAIGRFVRNGGAVIATGQIGRFDEHGRKRQTSALEALFAGGNQPAPGPRWFGRGMAISLDASELKDRRGRDRLREILSGVRIQPRLALTREDGQPADNVESYMFTNGHVIIAALHRNLDPSSDGTTPAAERLDLRLPGPYEIYDIRSGRSLGRHIRMRLEVGATAPVVLALAPRSISAPAIYGPSTARAGDRIVFLVRTGAGRIVTRDVVHIDVADPAGNIVPYYSSNLVVPSGSVAYPLPLAVNDKPGIWRICARDLLTGTTVTRQLSVAPSHRFMTNW